VAFGYSIEACAACSVLLWALKNPGTRAGRALNSAPLVHLGLASYSLYLWQQLWLSHETITAAWMVPLLVCGAVPCSQRSCRSASWSSRCSDSARAMKRTWEALLLDPAAEREQFPAPESAFIW